MGQPLKGNVLRIPSVSGVHVCRQSTNKDYIAQVLGDRQCSPASWLNVYLVDHFALLEHRRYWICP